MFKALHYFYFLESDKTKWLRSQVLALLEAYKGHYKTPGLRRPQMYENMSTDMITFGVERTAKQCQYKFAALKKQYVKYKDAQKASNSGGTPVDFDYAEEMDDIFGESHILGLQRTASSSLPENSTTHESSSLPENSTAEVAGIILDVDDDEVALLPKQSKRRRITVVETIKDQCAQLLAESRNQHADKIALVNKVRELQEQALEQNKVFMRQLMDKL